VQLLLAQNTKGQKNTVKPSVFFCAFGIFAKVSSKMLAKSTPDGNVLRKLSSLTLEMSNTIRKQILILPEMPGKK